MENKKYYTRSNGEQVEISTMETTHLTNSLAKKYRELFEATDKDDYSRRYEEIKNLKEDLHRRFNEFYDSLGDK